MARPALTKNDGGLRKRLRATRSNLGQLRVAIGNLAGRVMSYDYRARHPRYLTERNLHELLPGIELVDVQLRHKIELQALPYGEAYVLAAITQILAPQRVFEIGTFTGGGTCLMVEHAPSTCRVFTLDLPPGNRELRLSGIAADPPLTEDTRIGERFRTSKYAPQITQLYGDSATFDFSPYYGEIDFVFIDGAHSADYVRNDTKIAMELLSARGAIIWDDCSIAYPDVVKVLDDFAREYQIYRITGTRFAFYCRTPLLTES